MGRGLLLPDPSLTPTIRKTQGCPGLAEVALRCMIPFPTKHSGRGACCPPPQEGGCGAETGGTAKAREDQPSSSPTATSPGPVARGAGGSLGMVQSLREETQPTVPHGGQTLGCGPAPTTPKLSPNSDRLGVEFVVGKAQGPDATWPKILKNQGQKGAATPFGAELCREGGTGPTAGRGHPCCVPLGQAGTAQSPRQGSAPAPRGWLSV